MIILNSDTDKKIVSFLENQDEILFIPPLLKINNSTAKHIDLACFFTGKELFAAPEIYDFLKDRNLPFKVISGEKTPQDGYPKDILYNAAKVNNKIFCKKDSTDISIINYAEENNFEIIDVNQGYAKCNIVNLCDKAIITSDIGIFNAAEKHGIDALLIKSGNVFLEGFDTGFSGGASVTLENKIIFIGDITKHPSYKEISEFCEKHKAHIIYTENFPLTDIGSPIFFENI